MKLTNALLGLATIAAIAVNSQKGTTIQVAVGEGGILRYSPNNITAKVSTYIDLYRSSRSLRSLPRSL